MLTWSGAQPGKYLPSGGNQADSSTEREFPVGVTRKCRNAGEQVVEPCSGRSLPEKAASAVCAWRSVNTGTPLTYGPNQVERTCRATVVAPAAVSPASVGQPVKRHELWLWFVKAMYPPVCVVPRAQRPTWTVSWDALQLRSRVASLDQLDAAKVGTVTTATIPSKATFVLQRLIQPSCYSRGQASIGRAISHAQVPQSAIARRRAWRSDIACSIFEPGERASISANAMVGRQPRDIRLPFPSYPLKRSKTSQQASILT